jgi:GNAT superfamily N-acetyltransferase
VNIEYRVAAEVENEELNRLFASSWPNHAETDFRPVVAHSLTHVCAYVGQRLVGFVYLAWDGGIYAFLLDPTVHPGFRRQGIGRELVWHAAETARSRGIVWLHVDFEPHLRGFYRECGFRPTEAGLMHLSGKDVSPG